MNRRMKMSREERAKQFMPFAALKGYSEALRKKEKKVVARIELSDDQKEMLDRKFHQIQVKDMVTVIYYEDSDYIEKIGMISKIDLDAKILKVVNTKIPFENIYDLNSEKTETMKYGC
ncbi:MAG: YolD-like family protein [Lachnospiraceae bacterium]|nr:YolD-like family protein [Lachnospiraceae bacterium]